MRNKELAELIRKRNYTYREIAFLAGISATHVYRIVSGEKQPSRRVVFRLAKALGVKPDSLLKPWWTQYQNE